jgi:adhesin/invasin
MDDVSTARRYLRSAVFFLTTLASAFQAHAVDTYNPASGGQLQIPALAIGDATYSDVVLTIGSVVGGPTGSSPVGALDTYSPVSNTLTVPAVQVGTATYYNVTATVAQLTAVGHVSGADTYDGAHLIVPYMQSGTTIYTNVVLAVTIADVSGVRGGMPGTSLDQYDAAAGKLYVGAVQVGSSVYTNVILNVGPTNIVSIGGTSTGTGPAGVTSLTIAASGISIPVDGSQSVVITVHALNASNDLVPGVPVAFSATTGGALAVTQGTTDAAGVATATLSALGAVPGTHILVTATYGDLGASVFIQVVIPAAPASLQVAASAQSIPVDGSQTVVITAYALSASNELMSGVPVAFSASSGGALLVTQGTTNASGAATATLSALGATVGVPITVTVTSGDLIVRTLIGVVAAPGAVAAARVTAGSAGSHCPAGRARQATSVALRGLALDLVQLVPQQPAHNHVEHRDHQQAEECREHHAADDAGADLVP